MFGQSKHDSRTFLYQKIAVSFFLLSIFLIGVVFYISFAWATITVSPRPVPLSEGFTVQLVGTPGGQLASDQVPGTLVKTQLEGDGVFPTSQETVTSEKPKKMTGVITLINSSAKPQQLRATTRLLNPEGVLFRTQEFVVVPAGGQVDVSVIADKEGELSTFDDSRFILPGLWPGLQDKIYGKSFAAAKNDAAGVVHTFTEEDLSRAVAELSQKLKDKMSSNLDSEQVRNGETGASQKVIDVKIISSKTTEQIGDHVNQFSLKVTAAVTAIQYDEKILQDFVTKKLLGKVGPGYDLLPPGPGDITADVDSVDFANKLAILKVVAKAGRIRSQDSEGFDRSSLAGQSAEKIVQYFHSFDDVDDVTVQFYPFWVKRAPLLADHIHVLMKK